jgi:GR25 family glycosyltransferase involved in LPS biosynthesis
MARTPYGFGSVDLVLVINLERRHDRLALMSRQSKEQSLPFLRIPAIDGKLLKEQSLPRTPGLIWTPGVFANSLSHVVALSVAKHSQAEVSIVLEDDAILPDRFRSRVDRLLAILPDDWQIVLFGGWHMQDPRPVYRGVTRAVHTLNSHAYMVRSSAIEAIHSRLEKRLNFADHVIASCQCVVPTYMPDDFSVHQACGKSDCWDKAMDTRDGRVSVPEFP